MSMRGRLCSAITGSLVSSHQILSSVGLANAARHVGYGVVVASSYRCQSTFMAKGGKKFEPQKLPDYISDTTLNNDQKDVLHEMYQVLKSPLPPSQVYTRLSPSSQRLVSFAGGIEAYCALFPKYLFLTPQANGSKLLSVTSLFRASGSELLIRELTTVVRSSKRIHHTALFRALSPKAKTDFMASKTNSLLNFLKLRPGMFDVDREGMVTLVAPSSEASAPNNSKGKGGAAVSTPASPPTVADSESDRMSTPVLTMLWRALPNSFYIPMRRAYAFVTSDEPSSQMNITAFVRHVRNQPQGFLDIRSFGEFGDAESFVNQSYVRLVGDSVVFAPSKEIGDERSPEFEVTLRLGHALHAALEGKGTIAIRDLEAHLPAELFARLPFKGPAAILVFDRMQHLFRVQHTEASITALSPAERAKVDFTCTTSPTPRAIRMTLSMLQAAPISPEEFEENLPDAMKASLQEMFGSLPFFVNAHRSELFVRDNKLWTPVLAARLKHMAPATQPAAVPNAQATSAAPAELEGAVDVDDDLPTSFRSGRSSKSFAPVPVASMGQKQLLEYVHSCLPEQRATTWSGIRGLVDPAVFKHPAFSIGDPRDVLMTREDLFQCWDPHFTNNIIVARKGIPEPVSVYKEVRCMQDIYWQVALMCVGGALETSIMQHLSRDARVIIKRLGGLDYTLSLVPEWFDVAQHPSGMPGHSLVTYKGHLDPTLGANASSASSAAAALGGVPPAPPLRVVGPSDLSEADSEFAEMLMDDDEDGDGANPSLSAHGRGDDEDSTTTTSTSANEEAPDDQSNEAFFIPDTSEGFDLASVPPPPPARA